MSNILPKLAVASAVATACAFASAATIKFTADSNSKADGGTAPLFLEASKATVSSSGSFFTLGTIMVVTERSHFAGDEWQLSVSNGRFDSYGAASTAVINCNNGTNNPISFDAAFTGGNRSSDPSVLKWTISSAASATGAPVNGASCAISGLRLTQAGMTAEGPVRLSFAAKRSNSSTADYDPSVGGTATAANQTVASVVSQVGSISVSQALNGVVDFQNSLGLGFASDDDTSDTPKQDSLVFNFAKSTSNTSNSYTGSMSVSFTYTAPAGADFRWLDANGDGVCGFGATNAETTTANGRITGDFTATINAACTALTFTGTVATPGSVAGDKSMTISFGSRSAEPSAGNGTTITPFDWGTISSLTARTNIGSSTTIASASLMTNSAALDLGEWTSNGSQVVIPYMPYNSAGATKIDPVVYISNRSGVSAPATATMRDANGVKCEVALGTIQANRTVNVSTVISDAIKTCYNTSTAAAEAGHRLYIVINASLPSSTTDVFSAYTVGGSSRVAVTNSSNGAK